VSELRAATGTIVTRTEGPKRVSGAEISTLIWERYGKGLLVFILLLLGYELTFSHCFGDALTAAYELEGHFIQGPVSLVEFRHLVNHLWPFWLLNSLRSLNLQVTALEVLHFSDLITAAASVMLMYRILLEITGARFLSLAGTFAYATANCVWTYAGTGRMYSTSMLLVFAAYYLALQIEKPSSEGRQGAIAIAVAGMVCFACFFWLVHVFNVIGVGLLLPEKSNGRRRLGYLTLYSAAGIVLGLVVAVSCLQYVHIPLTRAGLQAWMDASGTPPIEYGFRGLMEASYGQANGFLATPDLLYMVHGVMLRDPVLVHLGSLPWQLGKFVFIWILLTLVYLYPWVMFKRATSRQKILIFALYIPLAINMFFALGWVGLATARFFPTMLSQVGLGAISMQDLLGRVSCPRLLGAFTIAALVFIAGDNLLEWELPSQRQLTVLADQAKAIRPYVHRGDLLVTFGKDVGLDDNGTYDTMVIFYTAARTLTVTNDAYAYNWDWPDWQAVLDGQLQKTQRQGGRLFVMDRLALGFNPPHAAWSERQHRYPTLRQFSQFLQTQYCVTPAFSLGMSQYFQVEARTANCLSNQAADGQRTGSGHLGLSAFNSAQDSRCHCPNL
jgi:hypothetical protein